MAWGGGGVGRLGLGGMPIIQKVDVGRRDDRARDVHQGVVGHSEGSGQELRGGRVVCSSSWSSRKPRDEINGPRVGLGLDGPDVDRQLGMQGNMQPLRPWKVEAPGRGEPLAARNREGKIGGVEQDCGGEQHGGFVDQASEPGSA